MPSAEPAAWETGFGAEGGLFRRLRAACSESWQAYTWHPFVRGLSDGSLPLPAFRRYLIQDYLFLIHFARAKALAVFKAESIEAMRDKTEAIRAILSETLMQDRKSTRLNSSHANISYAVFCLTNKITPNPEIPLVPPSQLHLHNL